MFKAIVAASALLAAGPAAASGGEWWYGESDNFRVYSNGEKKDAEELILSLERLDQAMRMFRGLPLNKGEMPDAAKPTVYQFGQTSDIGQLAGSQGVAGFFIPRAGNSVAFVPLEGDRQRGSLHARREDDRALKPSQVLFHEYAHYFMFQHAPAAYPAWYIEGFAELFGTLDLREDGFNLGDPPKYRSDAIQYLDFDVERVLNPPERISGFDVERLYAYGWLFTSYLSFEPSRTGQLAKYLTLINAGKPNLDAAREAFGDLKVLAKELDKYRLGRARGLAVRFPEGSAPRFELRQATPGEAARMKVHMRSTAGVSERQAAGLVDPARALVAQHPQSVPVLLAATEAELDARNLDEAEALAKRALAIDPRSIEAHLFLAGVERERAKTNPARLAEARAHYVRANKLDRNHPVALTGYYLSFVLANETPPEDALIALETAYRYAPFDPAIRQNLAHLLLVEKRDREAKLILGPVINSPHGGKTAEKYRELVAKLEAGDRAPLMEELRPVLTDKKAEEDS